MLFSLMLHQHWLLFYGVWLMDIVDTTQPITITVKLPSTSDLGECQSCLTDIAGLDRLSFTSSPVHNSNRPHALVNFQASGGASSFLRARVDCQNDVACGSMTITGSEPINTAVSLLGSLYADEHKLKPLCVLTHSVESFDCANCLKMTSGSPSIQKFHLVPKKDQERYLYALLTNQHNVFTPCKLSGICIGPDYEIIGDPCDYLLRKLSTVHYRPPKAVLSVLPESLAADDGLYHTTEFIYESVRWRPLCYRTSAPHDQRTNCLDCIALESSGMVVLVDHSTIEHASAEQAENSEQYVFVISKGGPTLTRQCDKPCRSITLKPKSECLTASHRSMDTSYPKGKIYYNMAKEIPRRNQLIPAHSSNEPKITKCMGVEHYMEHRELCRTCVEEKAGYAAKRLSHIDFLISLEMHLQPLAISSCISHRSDPTLCKKMTNVPDELCFYSGLPRLELHGRNGLVAPSTKHPVSLVLYEKATTECYTCLTTRFDVLIIDRFVTLKFWMVGVPPEYECFENCGYLAMVLKENLDISSLRTISSNSVTDPDHLTGIKRSHSFAPNDGNDRNDGISSEGHRTDQGAH
ncbi:unnamed protein product [Albugo candida]|uniref:Uncharacterized protein n=1 Tax=Albugo candida TaxID=65357 RepID=A0A024FTQ1_9STRA|nr:unnamed protein product [Albugo candida]|eukprot:CCI10327.1 unnamed protein product [Albugo candida]